MKNRTELFREKRKGIAKTEYIIMERLNDMEEEIHILSKRIDNIDTKLGLNDLSDQIETLTKRLDDMSEHLYYCARTDRDDLKNAFDEMMGNPIDELERIFK